MSSCRTERERRRFWGRPFRRTLRAIDRSLRLIEASTHAVDAAEGFAAERPLRAARHFELASDWLREITTHLSYAARGLSVMAGRIASTPSLPSSAPEELAAATSGWIDAVRKMESLSSRCDDSYIGLLEAMAGGALLDIDELLGDQGVPAPRRIAMHRPPERRSPRNSSCIRFLHERRQRSARSTVTEGARRICRGRAPPFLQRATSNHCKLNRSSKGVDDVQPQRCTQHRSPGVTHRCSAGAGPGDSRDAGEDPAFRVP